MSAITAIRNDLWLASDESCSLERLSRLDKSTYGKHCSICLDEFLDLPAATAEEIDIEGLDFDGRYLWVTGSHSLKRAKPKEQGTDKDSIQQLSEMVRETNRFMLARIPVVVDSSSGRTKLVKSMQDPDAPGKSRTAAQLFGTGHENMLTAALRLDSHLGRFLSIPCKENGFDIEGVAMVRGRLFLGLRGPVLGGWAVMLELKLAEVSPYILRLAPISRDGGLYKKHFLDLCGLGIRDLCVDGEGLLILAGPTMDLDGHVVVYRWNDLPGRKKECIVRRKDLKRELEFRFRRRDAGCDRAEGIARLPQRPGHLLVVYDSPSPRRLKKKTGLVADLFAL
jgi:hypothetical protein